jgi:hypothetical protein
MEKAGAESEAENIISGISYQEIIAMMQKLSLPILLLVYYFFQDCTSRHFVRGSRIQIINWQQQQQSKV